VSDLVPVATFITPVEAELARGYLQSYGISSVVFDGEMAPYVVVPIGIRLMVLDEDLAEAQELLADYNR
jgi:hypothetical protein